MNLSIFLENMNKLIIMTVSSILLAACTGNRVARQWAALPISEETDSQQLAAQIKAAPAQWKAAADFLSREDLATLPLGRYDLTPEGAYANIQEYTTRDSSKYEAHRDYIDVQVVVSGREQIFISALGDLSGCLQEYDSEKDIEFWALSSCPRSAVADSAHWVILFPSDAHEPCMTLDEPSAIRKVVVKIPYCKN